MSHLCKQVFLTFAVICLAGSVYGQTVSGVVTDATTGEPMPAVNIAVDGTTTGTSTDSNGEYSLTVPNLDVTLRFSFVGYETRLISIDGRTTVDVIMQAQAIAGEEVLVTGYSTQRRQDITAAVSSVDMESASRQMTASVLQRLDGRVAGVTVETSGSPGARNTVRIRGVSSFQNNDPLYIIDGTPVQGSFMNFLNPNDIESMQVLKDASAASIYGSRANNGVVIIETRKSGAAVGGPQVTLSARTGVATPVRGYNDFVITDALQYHEVVKRSFENAGEPVPTNIYGNPDNPTIPNYIWPNDGDNQTTTVDESTYSFPDNLIMPASEGTDWWDEVFGAGMIQDYNIAVAGGGSDYVYNVSFNYLNQEGTAVHNRYQRGSVRVNTEFDMGLLTVGENIAVSVDESVGGIPNNPGDFAEDGILGKDILMQPIVPVYDIGGNFASGKAVTLGNQTNPLKRAFAMKDSPTKNIQLFGNVFGRVDLMDNKVLVASRLGFNVSQTTGSNFTPMFPENSEPTLVQSIGEFSNQNTEWTWTNTVNYDETFAESHNVSVLVGQEANQQVFRGINGGMSGLLNTDPDSRFLQDALGDPDTKNVDSNGFKAALLSFFGKVDYNYEERYHLSATIRRDGSSRLGPNNQWGTFPAFSAGWRISNESFMADNELFSNIMLRVGWGITGNQQIPAGSTVNQFGGGTGDTFYDISGSGNSIVQGFRQTVIGNPDLKWEENESVNVGLDLEIFEGKFSFAMDVYQRDTENLLFSPNLPATAGVVSPPVVNIGKMRNTGFDLQLGTRGTINDEILWSVDFNGSHYKNEIVRIDGEQNFFFGPIDTRFGNQVINQVGQPIGAFYGLVTDGIFLNQEEVDAHADQEGKAVGRFRFMDIAGAEDGGPDGQVNAEDRTIIGDPHPDFTGGLDLGVRYRNWSFSATLFASIGNDIFDVQREFYVWRNFSTTVREDRLTESAVVEATDDFPDGEVINPGAKYPQLDQTDTFSLALSDDYVQDGSYLRLRNFQVGYNVPIEWLRGIRNMQVFIQGENLFTITGYDGLDPTLPAANIANAQGADIRDQYRGVDRGSYPSNRTISIGINATF